MKNIKREKTKDYKNSQNQRTHLHARAVFKEEENQLLIETVQDLVPILKHPRGKYRGNDSPATPDGVVSGSCSEHECSRADPSHGLQMIEKCQHCLSTFNKQTAKRKL